MNKKHLIWGFVGLGLVWGGWLIYRNNRNNKIDATTTPYEEALEKIKKID